VATRGLLSLGPLICLGLALPMGSFAAGPEGDSLQLLAAARSALESGNFARAGELYTVVVRDLERAGVADVRLASSLVDLGRLRAAEGRCGEASGLLLRGIGVLDAAAEPDSFERSEAWEALAKAYNCQRQYSKAEQALRRALDLERSAPAPRPDHLVELLVDQGAVYQAEHKFGEAESAFKIAQSVLDRNPRVDSNEAALLLNNLGMLLRLMGRNAESEAAFRQGLALAGPNTTWGPGLRVALQYNLASLEVAQKQYRDAAAHFEEAVRLLDHETSLPPRPVGELLRDYAACLRKLGDRRQAGILDTRAAALLNSQPDGDGHLAVDVSELARAK